MRRITFALVGMPILVALLFGVVTTWDSAAPARAGDSAGVGAGADAITAGTSHTCALRSGGVWCWGENIYGQLGNNSTSNSPVPVPVAVSGLASGVSAISAGSGHTCAVKDGAVWCWGRNGQGQLGDGTTADALAPIPVVGLGTGVGAISAGGYHTCALKDGGVSCWGYNLHGQLGNNSTTDSLVPVAVSGLADGVTAMSAGGYQTCAIRDGGASCWGWNASGELGNNSTTSSDIPIPVVGLESGVSLISAGAFYTCAVKDGAASCWGWNNYGQLGNNTTTDSTVPVPVSGLGSGVSILSTGVYHTCAARDGGIQCWGRNSWGQLGNNSMDDSLVPTTVYGLASGTGAVKVGREGGHTCALRDGAVLCWGLNGSGQLGNGGTTNSSVPVAVVGLPSGGVTAIETGYGHACAINGGEVSCWGYNDSGQLGNNSTLDSPAPVSVVGLDSGVVAVAGGGRHTCALKDGAVWCWGLNQSGQLGSGGATDSLVPVGVAGLTSGVTAIGVGFHYACALKDGAISCWGNNDSGQLGDGTNPGPQTCGGISCSTTPVAVSGLSSGVSALSVGGDHACALKDGGVWCWGANARGQLGNGTNTGPQLCQRFSNACSTTPIAIPALTTGVSAVTAGTERTCALLDGGAWCWGYGGSGELGNGMTANSNVPVAVTGLPGSANAISTGGDSSCALSDGGAWCWGYGGFGALGNGTSANSSVPVAVAGFANGTGSVRVGGGHACALRDGAAWCWGLNNFGQLGNNSLIANSLVPVPVVWETPIPPTATPTSTPTVTPTPTATPCPDTDCDGVLDAADNCPSISNTDQLNSDRNYIDNSPPYASGADDKTRPNSDTAGDLCDPDDDNDGLSDTVEFLTQPCAAASGATDAALFDTDGDRFGDGTECASGSDPTDLASKPAFSVCGSTTDSDGDKLSDRVETCFYNTDPDNIDTDGDRTTDGAKDGCEAASFNGDRIVNVADMGMLATAISNPAFRIVNVDVNKDGAWNPADQGIVASFISPAGQCP